MKQRLDRIERRLAPADEWDHLTNEELDEMIGALRSLLGLPLDGGEHSDVQAERERS